MNNRRTFFMKAVFLTAPFLFFYSLLSVFGAPFLKARQLSKDFILWEGSYYTLRLPKSREKEISQIKQQLEWFRTGLYTRFKNVLQLSDFEGRKIPVRIFQDEVQFKYFTHDRFNRTLDRNDGFYDPRERAIAIIAGEDPTALEKSLYHEMTHAIMDLGAPGNPEWSPWLKEGLATYFEQSEHSPRSRLGGNDRSAIHRVKLMVGGHIKPPFIPLGELLEVSQEKYTGEDNSAYYAESHALVCFLTGSPDYVLLFPKYILEERQLGPVTRQTFEQVFGPLPQVEKDFIAYLESLE